MENTSSEQQTKDTVLFAQIVPKNVQEKNSHGKLVIFRSVLMNVSK